MCNCIEEVTKKIHDNLSGQYKGKKITRINVKHTVLPMKDGKIMQERIAVPIQIHRANTQRTAIEPFVAAFCPFCGEKYDG